MSQRAITAQVTIERRGLGGAVERLQISNLAFKKELGNFSMWSWCQNGLGTPGLVTFPWRLHPNARVDDPKVSHSASGDAATYGYPFGSYIAGDVTTWDAARLRRLISMPGLSSPQTDNPFVIGALALQHSAGGRGAYTSWWGNMISILEVPGSQINTPYMHPLYTGSITTTAGQSYVTFTWDWLYNTHQHLVALIRIESGLDRGVYLAQNWASYPRRLYLMNIDGTKFVARATGAQTATFGYRFSFFNQTGVIPNSAGQVAFDGLYDPGVERDSKIFRIHFEKSGSPSPANEAQRGSYWLSTRQWLYGRGDYGDAYMEDNGGSLMQRYGISHLSGRNGFFDGCSSILSSDLSWEGWKLDKETQRLWGILGSVTSGNGSIGYWNYKSPESFREVATSAGGTPNDPLPVPLTVLGRPQALSMGADGTIYVTTRQEGVVDQTRHGWYAIRRDLSWQFVSAADVGITGTVAVPGHSALDDSRARTGTAGDTSTTATGHILSASAAFTAADVGRCIKISGNAQDNGTYLISVVNGAGDVTVTQLNGSAVSFTGGAGGTFQIGERLYLFECLDAAWSAGKMHWFDTLAFGQLFTQNVTMTDGANLFGGGHGYGYPSACDPQTGRVFWYSVDGVKHLNMYDPTAMTVTQRPLSDLAVQVPGSSANPTAPTYMYCLAVNPNPYFRELWVGTNQGQFLFDPDNFTGQLHRFYGRNDTTTYAEADGLLRSDGSHTGMSGYAIDSRVVTNLGFYKDGQVFAQINNPAQVGTSTIVRYNREAKTFVSCWRPDTQDAPCSTLLYNHYIFWDPDGAIFWLQTQRNHANWGLGGYTGTGAIHWQWIGGKWAPKEVVRRSLPDSVSSPGLSAKPLHSDLQDLIYGVKIKFTSSGAVGGENNEFLGRCAQRGIQRTDGATVGTGAFSGSGFNALGFTAGTDVGRFYLRIESGVDQGVYIISAVNSDNSIDCTKIGGAAQTFGTASGLSYSVWDMQSGTVVGPEVCTVLCNIGFSRDNTQDISGVLGEYYLSKTLLSEQSEPVKVCCDVLPPPGSSGIDVYYESWPQSAANYQAGLGAHLALPGTPHPGGRQLIDGLLERSLNGTYGRATIQSPANWAHGVTNVLAAANNCVAGCAVTVDFGTEVEVGRAIVRVSGNNNSADYDCALLDPVFGYAGMLANWLVAPDAGAPVASSVVRCSGTTNLNALYRDRTITLSSGDFFGTATAVTGTDGATSTVAPTIFTASAGKFSQANVGMILRVTSGTDSGNYRILSVSGDGSQVTIRNLDQTTKLFSATASSLAYTVWDGVQDEDMLACPNLGAATHRLLVEFIYNDGRSAMVRVTPHAALTNSSWQCVKPSWNLVKRIAVGRASPPEVVNNGTFMADQGKDNTVSKHVKMVADFSDLPTAKRKGRYWKFSMQNRGWASRAYLHSTFDIDQFEFFDPAGNRIGLHRHNRVGTVASEPQFFASQISRVDFLQASDSAVGGAFNGLASLSGTQGDTITLAGGNKFLGFRVRPQGNNGTTPGANAVFNITSADPAFIPSSDVGRLLRILAGPNAGIYRVATAPSTTQVTLISPAGNAVILAADATPRAWTLHEGINTGTSNPDYICFTTGGVAPGQVELGIFSISDDLTTIVTNEKLWKSLSNQNWEIRRRGVEDRGVSGVYPQLSARVISYGSAALGMAFQSGDIAQDAHGYFRVWPGDIGNGATLTGAAAGGNDQLTDAETIFTSDDVGRVILITTGANRGPYEITSVVNATTVALKVLSTGVAASFTADAALSYQLLGERRFRISRYVSVLRQ